MNATPAPTQQPQFLTTKEVMQRYRIASPATLWNWRKRLGFPGPVHHGRFYSLRQLEAWDLAQEQSAENKAQEQAA
ncbi:helix-turn-helix domain-containing protein [Shewanella sp. 3B26]|uniref:Helix-turn-helix domain-containing protein n=1 Tax=Shewanella zhuhaiensis TaxID=2919576 RepID=A0AAJ1BGF6_9GAMM|nr:helix-turn-helix domain-containing protein [Shewanella zhuhaiensis]MCH4294195.1 helix-turn-helix domain-containing protein [Shewanella zhuhaiensis]